MARRFSEDELIATLFAPLAGAAALGLRDDAALLPASKNPLVATTDALVAGVHFFADDPPGLIAKKALRVNLSDLAAKGAEPVGFLLAIALPPDWTNDWLAAFAAGLGEDALAYRCPLLGGDTVSTPGPLTLSITALGEAPEGRFVARTAGQAGDAIFVTGTIGDAALGLRLRRDEAFARRLSAPARDHLLERYLLPRPRLALAAALRLHATRRDGRFRRPRRRSRQTGARLEARRESRARERAAFRRGAGGDRSRPKPVGCRADGRRRLRDPLLRRLWRGAIRGGGASLRRALRENRRTNCWRPRDGFSRRARKSKELQ